jgi:hypothetical protein
MSFSTPVIPSAAQGQALSAAKDLLSIRGQEQKQIPRVARNDNEREPASPGFFTDDIDQINAPS